ncbi:YqcI/YcgG family protein [Alphaproteobacteria bacterium LSUCC0719]
MPKLYFDRNQIGKTFQATDWQLVAFNEFESTLDNSIRPFPCVFGVNGLRLNQLRFAFSDEMDAAQIAPALDHFVKNSRNFGPNTSLVVFSRPRPVESIERYERKFWDLIASLSELDTHPWPKHIPNEVNQPMWEFCFAGEPIFVVCNTPAHVLRLSRRSISFMTTFQPRWVFDQILGNPKIAEKSFGKVREHLKKFDLLPPSPHLGTYGKHDVREFRQYFLLDDERPTSCPFHSLADKPNEGSEVA